MQNSENCAKIVGAALQGAKQIYFVGIGGVHMSALAQYLAADHTVSGSDTCEGEGTRRLRRLGIPILIGHAPQVAARADLLVFTLAVTEDDPELAAARAAGVPCFSRAQVLGAILREYRVRIGISGAHGKSTVTAMLAQILGEAGRQPTVFCGASCAYLGGTFHKGAKETALFEACEYRDSFLWFSPTHAVILNVEHDHVDYFADIDAVRASFAEFAALPKASGACIYNADDENAVFCAAARRGVGVSFGMRREAAYMAKNASYHGGYCRFAMCYPDGEERAIALRVPGVHNVYNALAAATSADVLGVPREIAAAALSAFCGVRRRMEYKGVYCGARVYDDYAHHPTEIVASLRAARLLKGTAGRLFVVFQSHTYSRTAGLYDELCGALGAADRVILADVYAAREVDTLGTDLEKMAAKIGQNASHIGGYEKIADRLATELAPCDLLVVMGAGDIDKIFGLFWAKGFTSEAESGKIEE